MLWSTRTNSSRQVVGSETVWVIAGKPLNVPFCLGIIAKRAVPTAVGVIVSPGNLAPVTGFIGQSEVTTGAHRSLKLPVRSASEGTFGEGLPFASGFAEEVFVSRRHSCDQKKKVFFLSEL